MKTSIVKTGFMAVTMAAFALFTFTACEKDDPQPAPPTLKQQLVGTWNITSFNLGGTEYVGLVVDSASITYQAFVGAQGNFLQKINYIDGEIDSIKGTYTVDEETEKVIMTAEGEINFAEVDLPASNKLELRMTQDDEPLVVKATKK